MPSFAIFLRAVNVGGHQATSVAALAKKLDLVNIGAAGTFVAHGGRSAAALKKLVAAELGFDTEVMVVPAAKLLELVSRAPLTKEDGKPFVAVLSGEPNKGKLPAEDGKGSRLIAVEPPFALAVVLPGAKPGTSVGALVEKALGVPATVRGWPTMERVAKALATE